MVALNDNTQSVVLVETSCGAVFQKAIALPHTRLMLGADTKPCQGALSRLLCSLEFAG